MDDTDADGENYTFEEARRITFNRIRSFFQLPLDGKDEWANTGDEDGEDGE